MFACGAWGDRFGVILLPGNRGRKIPVRQIMRGQTGTDNAGIMRGQTGPVPLFSPDVSLDNQTCTNAYDDLSRLTNNSCGSLWAQTFTYDAFGNLSKSGTSAWQPNYNHPLNQYQSGWNGVSYDTNGNLLYDTFNTYTWNVYGDLASANGVALTYDALDRMVENANGASQFVYAPNGQHPLAHMAGQQLSVALVPLPAGAIAVYYSSGWFNTIMRTGSGRRGCSRHRPELRLLPWHTLRLAKATPEGRPMCSSPATGIRGPLLTVKIPVAAWTISPSAATAQGRAAGFLRTRRGWVRVDPSNPQSLEQICLCAQQSSKVFRSFGLVLRLQRSQRSRERIRLLTVRL